MTGGQPVDGPISVQSIAHSVRAEGVDRIALVSDEPELFDRKEFPSGISISHRRDMDAVQRELREIPGVTVLIYAQTCATEKRRRRKRGKLEDPGKFVVINDLVCEGCGDCSIESNCLSVIPRETPFGRKRQIEQHGCNKDYSCLNGFCPSFVTVEGDAARPHVNAASDEDFEALQKSLDTPEIPAIHSCYDLLVTGVGGTGVITVGALITMAAHLEGKGASELDFMGFAQKFGPVLSYLRIGGEPADIHQVRIEPARADALIGCDLVVSSSPKASITYQHNHTRALVNTAEMLTGDFIRHRDASLRPDDRIAAIAAAVGEDNLNTVDANQLAERLMGDTIYANVLLVGCAWQRGLIPVSLKALLRAIELNGIKIDANKRAFAWGRIAAANSEAVQKLLTGDRPQAVETLDTFIQRRSDFLIGYQNEALAERYNELVTRVRDEEAKVSSGDELTRAVAKSYFKLLSYKDEYEVARLHTREDFLGSIARDFGKKARLRFHLAPPILNAGVDARGRPRKKEFGAWILPVFRLLASMRGLRGSFFDIFAYTAERRMERALIVEFEKLVEEALKQLRADNVVSFAELAGKYMDIRGYGPVKEQAVSEVRKEIETGLRALDSGDRQAA
jgi:indolepyruvate ferredoxin oxidoreductase